MAGTFSDQATLATDNAFIGKCRVALVKRAVELANSADAKSLPQLRQVAEILSTGGESHASRMAWLVGAGNPTIASAAPAVPNDQDTQYAVNVQLALLLA